MCFSLTIILISFAYIVHCVCSILEHYVLVLVKQRLSLSLLLQCNPWHPEDLDEDMGLLPQQLRWGVHGRAAGSQWIQNDRLVEKAHKWQTY